ncbi:MAG TPA: alpha-glucosidase C-terminal domain-containing protein, partial [Phnomibacter sp.]|nr:alpha-glucosidase C-terminal domain-containing protein [Phnomibacter sp.]
SLNEYAYQLSKGKKPEEVLKEMRFSNRDNGRTPMQWDASPNAGFTTGTPWIAINANYVNRNVALQEKDPESCLNHFRAMTRLRREHKVLVYGKYTLLDADNANVYAYTRELNGKKLLVLLNFSGEDAPTAHGLDVMGSRVLINNYKEANSEVLKPFQAVIFEMK